jgi:hypothetical protein
MSRRPMARRVLEMNPTGCGHVSSEIPNGSGGPADYQQYVEDRSLSSTRGYLRAAVSSTISDLCKQDAAIGLQ